MTPQQKFGASLRRRREQQGLSLKELAESTKISASLLAGIERGDCSRWPGGIYSRAWVREYALAIGLDADQIATRFTRCFTQVAFPDGTPEEAEAARLRAESQRTWWRSLFASWRGRQQA